MTLHLAWLLCCLGAALGRGGTNLTQPAPRSTPTFQAAIPEIPSSPSIATGTIANSTDILPVGDTSDTDPLKDFAALIPVPDTDDSETDDPSISVESTQSLTDDDEEDDSNFDATLDRDYDDSPDDLLSIQLQKEDEAFPMASQDDSGYNKDLEHFHFNGNDKINSNITPHSTPKNSTSSSATSHLPQTVTDDLRLNRTVPTDTNSTFPSTHKKPDYKSIKGKSPNKTPSIGADVTTHPPAVTPSKKTNPTPSTAPTTPPAITNPRQINSTLTNPIPLVPTSKESSQGKLWRGIRCEGLQYKGSPDCLVAVPSQPMYPWDVFRTTYEVIMAELMTRYTVLGLDTPTLDGVKVFCNGMEELKLALRWCSLLLPNATNLMIMPQSTVSFYLDRGRYTFADQWNYDAVEVRCPATPPFWIRRFDPLRCDTDNAECLDRNMDLKSDLEKTTIPEGVSVTASW